METKIITIQQKVNMLVTVNIFLLIGEKVIIVDTGIKNSYKLVLKKLKELNISKDQISLILVTHSHPDHCLGITNLKKVFKVPVAVTGIEGQYLENGTFSPVVPLNLLGKIVFQLLKKLHAKHDDYVIPDVVFKDMLDLSKYGIEGKAILTPGHSIGGCSIILENGNCIVGDLIISDTITKKPRINLFATDLQKLKKNMLSILRMEGIHTIYTSHGFEWKKVKIQSELEHIL